MKVGGSPDTSVGGCNGGRPLALARRCSPRQKCQDSVIIGGGSAGLCASVAAARKGAKVILIERSDRLGGMGTQAMAHTFCGLYNPDVSKPPSIANEGLPAEIEKLMREATGAAPVKMGKVYVLPQSPDAFTEIAHRLTSSEPNLEVRYHTTCTGITREPDGSFLVSTGEKTIHCRAIIDTSADALAAEFLGATRLSTPPEKLQRSAFIFSMKEVAPAAAGENFRMRLALEIVRAVASGGLPLTALGTACRASTAPGEIFFTTDLDPATSEKLLETGRVLSEKLASFLRSHFPEYTNATGPFPAAAPGIRESYRWLGEYTLTADDLLNATGFPDTVAHATWPMEMRETTKGPRMKFFDNPVPANIPLRCLKSAEIPGVFFAGRCISATHEALASVRVMGTCFATGQAVGIAAADYLRKSSPNPPNE